MRFIHWYIEPFKKYATFSGRARRKEFWIFTLFQLLIGFIFLILEIRLGLATDLESLATSDPNAIAENFKLDLFSVYGNIGILRLIFVLITLLPATAVQVRRLHDTGRSGLWVACTLVSSMFSAIYPLLSLVGVLLSLIQFVWFCLDSEPGKNKYGENPKGISKE